MITTKGVYHIGIPVNDVERAVKFYTEILGMTIAKLNRDDMGDHLNRADLRSGDSMVVLFSSSGSGISRFLFHRSLEAFMRVCADSDVFATTGVGGPPIREKKVRELGVVRDNQNLVAASDLVISTAGKSTIDESASSGTPMIAIPIKNHAEQERNAAELGFTFGDVDRLEELIPKLLGKRSEPARYAGAKRTADYLASLFPST